MIPADVASRLRLAQTDLPAPPQPQLPAAKLADLLSEFAPGQRLMAEILSLLPNGAYRATIAQREIVLALPFTAKSGDALELEVVDSDGQLTLAFVANRTSSANETPANASVSATLSRTGKLIGDLMGSVDDPGSRAPPAALNRNQPLLDDFPENGAQLAPILKEAIARSGMFYESHQADWVGGRLPTASLLQEPQGQLSATALGTLIQSIAVAKEEAPGANPVPQPNSPLISEGIDAPPTQASTPAQASDPSEPPPATERPPQPDEAQAGAAPKAALGHNPREITDNTPNSSSAQTNTPAETPRIPTELSPLVRQQLDALATQNFVWQGQIWPGQQLHWEIEEEYDPQGSGDETQERHWQTRLRLSLPNLGDIEATLHLGAGGTLDIALTGSNKESGHTLQNGAGLLNQRLTEAGLKLTKFSIRDGQTKP